MSVCSFCYMPLRPAQVARHSVRNAKQICRSCADRAKAALAPPLGKAAPLEDIPRISGLTCQFCGADRCWTYHRGDAAICAECAEI